MTGAYYEMVSVDTTNFNKQRLTGIERMLEQCRQKEDKSARLQAKNFTSPWYVGVKSPDLAL